MMSSEEKRYELIHLIMDMTVEEIREVTRLLKNEEKGSGTA